MALKSSSYDPFEPRVATDATPTELDSDRVGMVFRDANAPGGVEPTEVRQLAPETSWRDAGRWEPALEGSETPKPAELARICKPRGGSPRTEPAVKAPRKKPAAKPHKLPTVAEGRPDLAAQWHPTRNGDLMPCDVTLGSRRKVVWACPACGHEWEATVNSRSSGSGCPLCARRGRRKFKTAVVCVETGEVFGSLWLAANRCRLGPNELIAPCLDNPDMTVGGYHWRRLDEEKGKTDAR